MLLFGVVHPPHTTLENEDRGSGLFPPVTDSVSSHVLHSCGGLLSEVCFFPVGIIGGVLRIDRGGEGKTEHGVGNEWALTVGVGDNYRRCRKREGPKKWERNVPLPRVVVDLGHLLELLCRATMSASDLDPWGFVYHRGKDDRVDLFGVVTVSGR